MLDDELQPLGAFLSGSMAAGLGHGASDIDLYVVVDTVQSPAERTFIYPTFRVDVCQISVEDLRCLVLGVKRYGESGATAQVSNGDLHRLVRIALMVIVLPGPELDYALAGISEHSLRQLLIGQYSRDAAGYSEDAYGAVAIGDWFTALTASAAALCAGNEACLAVVGDLYVGPKFLFRRLTRHNATRDLGRITWTVLHDLTPTYASIDRGEDRDSIKALVERRLEIGNGLVARSIVEGWDGCLDEVITSDGSGPGPRRNPYVSLIRIGDGYGFHAPNQGYECDVDAAKLWCFLDGSPISTVSIKFATSLGADPNAVRSHVESGILQLVSAGLATC